MTRMQIKKAELWLSERENIKEIAAYLRSGFSAYVNVNADTKEVGYALLTTSSRWNYGCPHTLTHIIRGFEGGHPEMVNGHDELLSPTEADELKVLQAKDEDYGLDDYFEDKDIDISERQIELWVDEFDPSNYEIEQ